MHRSIFNSGTLNIDSPRPILMVIIIRNRRINCDGPECLIIYEISLIDNYCDDVFLVFFDGLDGVVVFVGVCIIAAVRGFFAERQLAFRVEYCDFMISLIQLFDKKRHFFRYDY